MNVDPGSRPMTLRDAVARVRELEGALHHAQAERAAAVQRADRAVKAAEDASRFAQLMLRGGKGHA